MYGQRPFSAYTRVLYSVTLRVSLQQKSKDRRDVNSI